MAEWHEIARKQQAEIERLRAELDEANDQVKVLDHMYTLAQQGIAELQAEIERLGDCNQQIGASHAQQLNMQIAEMRQQQAEIERLRKLAKKLYECTTLQGDIGWEVACGYRIDNPWLEEE